MTINTERLRNLLGSEAAAQRFVDLFQQQLPGQLAMLQQAIATADWETVSNTAHALKSQCRYLGMDATADMLQLMEDNPAVDQDLSALTAWQNG